MMSDDLKKNKVDRVLLIMLVGFFATRPSWVLCAGSPAEENDDIVCTFFYPWYGNPDTNGWRHWQEGNHNPPATWSSLYLPDYPDSQWNPRVQLYDSMDTRVLKWQDKLMAASGIDIAIASWWGIGSYEDRVLRKAVRVCKNVKWCIYYEPEGYRNPTSQEIYRDLKYVIDDYGSSGNYAKIDDKWLVFVYVANERDVAARWSRAKSMLASDGYDIYLSGDRATFPGPWDSIHNYDPTRRWGLTDAPGDIDDSAWISPGFWKYSENPRLLRSLSDFKSSWNSLLANKSKCRFILIETWNEWHEGSQIEPGRQIVPDSSGYHPAGNDYGYDFIDAIGLSATFDLQWKSGGHRPVVPVRLQAKEMIWDDDGEITLAQEEPNKVLIRTKDIRIGSSVLVPETPDSNGIKVTVRANLNTKKKGMQQISPKLVLYLDDKEIKEWEVQGNIPQKEIETGDKDYSAVIHPEKGIHKIEIAMEHEPGQSCEIVVDSIDLSEKRNKKKHSIQLAKTHFGRKSSAPP